MDRTRLVRSLFFDKTPSANWKVPWHQDLTIAGRERIETEGYGQWSIKAGVPHVQLPVQILERMLVIRLHLDDTNETNGALKLIPGSHRSGRLTPEEIWKWVESYAPTLCDVPAGGILLMKPLLLHASSQALYPSHRRVLHFEYAAGGLPNRLQWQ